MNLPSPSERYDQADEVKRNQAIEQADRQNWKKTGDVDHPHSATIRGRVTTPRVDPVSGAGLGIGVAAIDYAHLLLAGAFTSGGASTTADKLFVGGTLTAASGDTGGHSGARLDTQITTQGAAQTIAVVSQLYVNEPQITVGAGDTVTVAATVYVPSAPTEGTTNAALYVASGASMFGGVVRPIANDGAALGSAAVSFSDLFLASGGVINFANGNVTLTHSSGTLTLGQSLAVGGDLRLTSQNTGIPSSTTQTQGQGPLTAVFNQVSTVANPNDTVTLPAPGAGQLCVVRNDGANTLQVFPSSGVAINGLGTNNSTTIAAGSTTRFWATSGTQWYTW